jgi:Tfp pilus assembly protein PilF
MRVEYMLAVSRDTEALEMLEEVLVDEPNNMYALVSTARLARELGQRERALEVYRKAVGLRPGLAEVRVELQALEAEVSP